MTEKQEMDSRIEEIKWDDKSEFVEVLNEKCINDWTVQHGWTWIHKRSTDDL